MPADPNLPMLVAFLHGEADGPGRLRQDARLARWARAFDDWMAELTATYKRATFLLARSAWRRLLQHIQKEPWKLEQTDIEQHVLWMQSHGFAAQTTCNSVAMIGRFYRWCEENKVDPALPAGFNPTGNVERPKVIDYDRALLLSRLEVDNLLAVMRQDGSPLGKRDYAFVLSRLRVGLPLKDLVELKWEQVREDQAGAWIHFGPDGRQVSLAPDAWEAIRDYLRSSGRLESMAAGKYVFAPLKIQSMEDLRDRQEAWAEDRSQDREQVMIYLKRMGKLAGISAEKLTWNALRWTAVRMRAEAGDGLEEIHAFLGSNYTKRKLKYKLKKLPELPADPPLAGPVKTVSLPKRSPGLFKPWTNMTHGARARFQPPEEVEEILKEGIKGLDEEVACLRTLGRLILQRQEEVEVRKELVDLMDAYTRIAGWMNELFRIEQRMEAETGGIEAGPFVEMFIAMKKADDIIVTPEELRRHVLEEIQQKGLAGAPEESARQLAEEVASTRLVMRRAFSIAIQSQDTAELVRLADIYGRACVRLVKMLRTGSAGDDRVEEYLAGLFYRAIDEKVSGPGAPPPSPGFIKERIRQARKRQQRRQGRS